MIAFYENQVALLVIGKEGGYEKEGVATPVSSVVSGETLYSLCLVLFPPSVATIATALRRAAILHALQVVFHRLVQLPSLDRRSCDLNTLFPMA